MGRGAQDTTRNMTDQQLSQTNALNQQLLAQQQALGNQVGSQYQNLLNNPGYSAADKAAITGQSQGALSSAFDALQQSAMNRVARTRNGAGFGDLEDELARQKGQQEANLAQQNQLNFSNTAYQRQMSALQGLSARASREVGCWPSEGSEKSRRKQRKRQKKGLTRSPISYIMLTKK